MLRNDIDKRLRSIIEELFNSTETIVEDTNFRTDLSLDSLDTVELIMEIEKVFNIVIPDEDCEAFFIYSDVLNYVEKKIKKTLNETNRIN